VGRSVERWDAMGKKGNRRRNLAVARVRRESREAEGWNKERQAYRKKGKKTGESDKVGRRGTLRA